MTNDTISPDVTTKNDSPVLFTTYKTHDGHLIGEMTLNDPKSLNALSVDMCALMSEQLTHWQANDDVVAVLLRGAGDKAFCAGGNIRKLYDSMVDDAPFPNQYASTFFGGEYALYRQMHFYNKPIILWGNGFVMGGGMGLMAACSHRIVTETTKFAMPEITIGLFPDASGSWFLQRMPAKTGLFLGLTGAMCNANDAKFANLAEYTLPSDSYENVIEALTTLTWPNTDKQAVIRATATKSSLYALVSRSLSTLSHSMLTQSKLAQPSTDESMTDKSVTFKPSKLAQYWQTIETVMNSGGLAEIDALLQDADKLAAIDDEFANDKWTQRALSNYRHGAPIAAALTYEIFYRVKDLSLEQILYMETNVAIHAANNPDFREGVRALLIDKDKTPQWSRTLEECLSCEGSIYIASHFVNPYPKGEHIFADWLDEDTKGVQAVK